MATSKAARRTGTVVLREVVATFSDAICALTDRDLRLLKKRAAALSQTNCWWFEYGVAGAIRELVEHQQEWRRTEKRGVRNAAPPEPKQQLAKGEK